MSFETKNEEERDFWNRFYYGELKAKENKHLIGLKARIKHNLKGYSWVTWGLEGVIVESDTTPYLYIKFDEYPNKANMKMCVLMPNSYEVV